MGKYFDGFFEATYDPHFSFVEKDKLKSIAKDKLRELVEGLEGERKDVLKSLADRLAQTTYEPYSLFSIDFPLERHTEDEKKRDCVLFSDLVIAGLEELGREDIIERIKVKDNYDHVWLIYEDDERTIEVASRHHESDETFPLERLLAINQCLLGYRFWNCENYEKALEYYGKAAETDPSSPQFWTNKGSALFELGRHDEALESFDRALEINPSYKTALNNREKVLERIED